MTGSHRWRLEHEQTPLVVLQAMDAGGENVLRSRFDTIPAFEDGLGAAGTRIVKLYLHISQDEQMGRFARRAKPGKRWNCNDRDLDEHARRDDHRAAYEVAISEGTTAAARWCVVPADNTWRRHWVVSRIVIETGDDMDPQLPAETR